MDILFCNSSLGNGKEVNLVEEILLSVIFSIIAGVDWYVKAEDIVLKNKGNQNAGSPQNHTPQGQPKK